MLGLVGDLSLSKDGSTVLVATSPNREYVPEGSKKPTISAWSAKSGRVLWKHGLPAPIKAQTISSDGKRAVAAHYDDELAAWDEKGRVLWKTRTICEPHLLSDQNVVCFHDDDNEPGIAFRVYDRGGKQKAELPVSLDALSFAADPESRQVALGLAQGELVHVGAENQVLWKRRIAPELISVAIARGLLAALSAQGELFLLAGADGQTRVSRRLEVPGNQLAFAPDASALWIWGNTAQGQSLSRISTSDLTTLWSLREPRQADLVSHLSVVGGAGHELAIVGFEDVYRRETPAGDTMLSKRHHVLGISREGKVVWDIVFDPGANLYLVSGAEISPGHWRVAAAADDGQLSVYEIEYD